MRARLSALILLATLGACFVNGESVTAPQDPEYAILCDSIATCLNNTATIGIQATRHRYPWER